MSKEVVEMVGHIVTKNETFKASKLKIQTFYQAREVGMSIKTQCMCDRDTHSLTVCGNHFATHKINMIRL